MKLKFDSSLAFQADAIDSIVRVFDGQPLAESTFSMAVSTSNVMGMSQSELGLGNRLVLDDARLLENVRTVQEANSITKVTELQSRHFSIEMETGQAKPMSISVRYSNLTKFMDSRNLLSLSRAFL